MAVIAKKKPKKPRMKRKEEYCAKLKTLMAEYSKVLVVKADNVGSHQMQLIRKGLRGDSVLLMGKNTLMKKALSDLMTVNDDLNIQNLMDLLKGNVGLIFTKGDLKKVKEKIDEFKVGAPARVGMVAPINVVISSGTTSLEPSNTSFFQALNIPTKINKGAVEIINQVHLIKKGQKIGSSEVALLGRLNIKPFTYSLVIEKVYVNGSVYGPEILDLTEEYLAQRFCMGLANVSAFALSISYPAISVIPHMIVSGFKDVLGVSLEIDYPLADKVKEYLKDDGPGMEVAAVPVPTSATSVVSGEEQAMEAVVDPLLPYSSTPEQEQEQASERKGDVESLAMQNKLSPLSKDVLYEHIVVRPMYEIFSITIHCHPSKAVIYPQVYKLRSLSDGRPCEIFGLVRVFVEGGKTYDIYNRTKHNSESVNLGGLLSINTFPIVHTKRLKVAIYLFDLAHDCEIVNGIFMVDYEFIQEYNEVRAFKMQGEYGFACIHHATFQHGVVANIESIVLKASSEVGLGAQSNLIGTVSACLDKIYTNPISDDENKFPSIILFDNKMLTREMKFVQFGSNIHLSRTCVVVPAFFYLTISVKFENHNGEDVCKEFKLKARHEGLDEMSGKGVNCEMELKVKWCNGYAEEEFPDEVEPTPQSLQVFPGAEQSSTYIDSAIPIVFPCVEVFSVVVYVNETEDASAISGKIIIKDSSRIFCIFEDQDIWCYEMTSLALKSPPCSFDDEPFQLLINLVDEKDRIVSKGNFLWDFRSNESNMLYNDKLICSIIEGDVGYAAVHYSMITYGVQAKLSVSVLLKSLSEFRVSVYGSITAKYGSYEYSCIYDESYYRSIIFSRSKDDFVTVDVGTMQCELPLIKPFISVPLEDLLILEVNLTVVGSANEDGKVEQVGGTLEFKPNVTEFSEICRKDYAIRVATEWSDIRSFPNEREQGPA